MRFLTKITFVLIVLFSIGACQQNQSSSATTSTSDEATKSQRIVSLSGLLTEVLFELGYGDQIVGRDVTSTYPAEAQALPDLGHVSKLNVEAILALKPDVIFVEESQKSKATLTQLSQAGIELIFVSTSFYISNAINAARVIGQHLHTDPQIIDQMAQKIEADSLQLVEQIAKYSEQPKVLFIYARGAGRLMVAGKNTSAAAIIERAGGKNAIQSFSDFRALTPEALIEASPEVILMFTSGLASLDGKSGLEQITGIPQTPAFKNNRIIAMDGHYLTAFGPRIVQAAIELSNKMHQKQS
ncbi:MAG: ABC transporter substrate-binding protein [Bacteroidota bacterium]